MKRTYPDHGHNIEVFRDTMKWCSENEKLRRLTELSEENTRIVPESETVEDYSGRALYEKAAEVIVSKKRTFEAASAYKGKKTCVLNFASYVTPGGGVKRGSNAQEESLCRISTLYPCLDSEKVLKSFYLPHRKAGQFVRFNSDDCIISPGVLVIKNDDFDMERLDENEWFSVDVITCAAPDLRAEWISHEDQYRLHVKRLTRILNLAAAEKEEVIILGAFGCGAFGNDPGTVAGAMKDAQAPFLHCFRAIEYAVYCPPYGEPRNYNIFSRIFC